MAPPGRGGVDRSSVEARALPGVLTWSWGSVQTEQLLGSPCPWGGSLPCTRPRGENTFVYLTWVTCSLISLEWFIHKCKLSSPPGDANGLLTSSPRRDFWKWVTDEPEMEFTCPPWPCWPRTTEQRGRRCHLGLGGGGWPRPAGGVRWAGQKWNAPAPSRSRASGQLRQKGFVAHIFSINLPLQSAWVDECNKRNGLRGFLQQKHRIFFLLGPNNFSSCQHQLLREHWGNRGPERSSDLPKVRQPGVF